MVVAHRERGLSFDSRRLRAAGNHNEALPAQGSLGARPSSAKKIDRPKGEPSAGWALLRLPAVSTAGSHPGRTLAVKGIPALGIPALGIPVSGIPVLGIPALGFPALCLPALKRRARGREARLRGLSLLIIAPYRYRPIVMRRARGGGLLEPEPSVSTLGIEFRLEARTLCS